jgi:hypothetical protein
MQPIDEGIWPCTVLHGARDMAIVPYHDYRGVPPEWRRQARARCAEILNARAAKEGGK